ncbi:hypothetical protein EV122DRAFT_295168 [Schizophyllum commune]
MRALVARKGLEPPSAMPRRYLWTTAFAIFNLITLHRRGPGESGEYLALARWLSGLSEEEGSAHFTRGGLRIGKPLSERQVGEPPDREFEWDQAGQYFHFLTKWLHALAAMTGATGETQYLIWVVEVAKAVHSRFKHSGGTRIRLVSSMGQHDAVDALVAYTVLRVAAHKAALDLALNHSAALLKELETIENFWTNEEIRKEKSWTGHEDINAVMLATTLAPDAFLEM